MAEKKIALAEIPVTYPDFAPEPTTDPSMPPRYHALDTLRAAAMFAGIALHGWLTYTTTRVPFWPAEDSHKTILGDVFVFSVHEFRMQLFFLLAGFFGALIHAKYGLDGMIRHRLLRLGLPLLVALFTVQPLMQLLWLHGEPEALKFLGIDKPDLNEPVRNQVAEHLFGGEFLRHLRPAHLWFLYYLLMCFALVVPFLLSPKMSGLLTKPFLKVLTLPGRSIVLSLLLFPSVWFSHRWAIDPPAGWVPVPHILLYYLLFFGFGWGLYLHRDRLPDFVRGWKSRLLVANLIVLPTQLFFVAEAMPLMKETDLYPEGMLHYKLFAVLLGNVYTWLMVAGLMGLFLDCFPAEKRWVRYLADSSYWCYLTHLLPVIALQLILRPLDLPAEVKFLLVMGGSVASLLYTYERFVRHGWIGVLLNGKRAT